MKRYEEFVVEASKGITFEVLEEAEGGLIIKVREQTKKCLENYANPVVPEGYKHICGEWHNGFVIERISDGSQFVWIPVGGIEANAMLEEVLFTEKFGRRIYFEDDFFYGMFDTYKEPLTGELGLQIESVNKYGGFYISRYNISQNKQTGAPQSVQGVIPWTNVSFDEAKKVAASIEDSDVLKSHLTFGAEYDSVLEWFIENEARSFGEITRNSTHWGNHLNTEGSPKKLVETGSCEDWCTCNIYDLAGNVSEWTQECNKKHERVIRGGNFKYNGNSWKVADRNGSSANKCWDFVGFRAVLCIR